MGSDNFGIIGAIVIGALAIVACLVVAFLLAAAKQAHDDVIEEQKDETDLVG